MVAQRVEREVTDGRTSGERAIALEVQRQIHRVQAAVQQPRAPVPLAGRVERRDVVADVMADDHAVAQIVEKRASASGSVDARSGSRPA